jgi:hypothetical protein
MKIHHLVAAAALFVPAAAFATGDGAALFKKITAAPAMPPPVNR